MGPEDVEDDRGHEDRGAVAYQGTAQDPGGGAQFGGIHRHHGHIHRQKNRKHDQDRGTRSGDFGRSHEEGRSQGEVDDPEHAAE